MAVSFTIFAVLYDIFVLCLFHVGTYRTPEMEIEERNEQYETVWLQERNKRFRVVQ